MNRKMDPMRLSQLADGELSSDEVNEVLLAALDDADSRERLKALLRMRIVLASWRRRKPTRPVSAVWTGDAKIAPSAPWRLGSLAAAAVIGGLLVLGGFLVAQRGDDRGQAAERTALVLPYQVTAEQQREVARVFALHESVAGPLAWYAADDRIIRVALARGTEVTQTPIAVLLRVGSAGPADAAGSAGPEHAARTLVIVCREDRSAVVELPAESPGRAGLRVYLAPRAVNGQVEVQYAIAVDGDEDRPAAASLAGQRPLGLAETPLGQVAWGDRLLSVEAAAWPLPQERN